MRKLVLCSAIVVAVGPAFPADDFKVEDGFRLLFNGKDLTGWEHGYCPPGTKPNDENLDGKTASKNKIFHVADGLLVANGGLRAIYTTKEFNKDFHLKLEFRTPADNKRNNSGVFIRGPQLQLDGTNIGGLTNVFKNVKDFKESDWNEIDISVKGREAICKCNGELVGKAMKIPATGTIGLQSEIGKFEFRRIRIKKL